MAKMTKTEARELRSLVRSEYGVLKSEINSRRSSVSEQIKDELLALDKSKLAVAVNKIERLETKAHKFKEDCDKDLEAVNKKYSKLDKDFAVINEKYLADREKVSKKERELRESFVDTSKDLVKEGQVLRKELEGDGFVFSNIYGAYRGDSVSGLLSITNVEKGEITVKVAKDLQTKDFQEKFKKAQQLISQQASAVQSQLHREEQDMVRELTLNTLESDEAVAFFHNMPTVDELLPAPDVKQLKA